MKRVDGIYLILNNTVSRTQPSTVYLVERIAHNGYRLTAIHEPEAGQSDHYHVFSTDRGYTCDCADFAFRKEDLSWGKSNRRDPNCKHIEALISLRLFIQEPPP
jgi:hypothetical protein